MGSFSIWHWLIVLLIVMLVFGTKKLRNMGSDLGGAVKGFKEGMKDGSEATGGTTGAAPGAAPAQTVAQVDASKTIDVVAREKSSN